MRNELKCFDGSYVTLLMLIMTQCSRSDFFDCRSHHSIVPQQLIGIVIQTESLIVLPTYELLHNPVNFRCVHASR
jgi:hypothetical protein